MTPLAQLKDIHLPAEIGNWPPACGWWLLLLLFAVALIFSIKALILFRRRRLAKRQALQYLAQLAPSQSDWPVQLNHLLKRLVITYFPQADVAALHLHSWSDFLASHLPLQSQAEFSEQMQILQRYIYRPKGVAPDFELARSHAERWIEHAIPPKATKIHNKELANV